MKKPKVTKKRTSKKPKTKKVKAEETPKKEGPLAGLKPWKELGPLSDPPVPQEVHPALEAFPARVIGTLLPEFDVIPDQFKRTSTPWCRFVSMWFAGMLPDDIGFYPKPGIDAAKAWRHISTCLRSYEPKHEHKMAGCAYLASCFFEKVASPSKGVIVGEAVA